MSLSFASSFHRDLNAASTAVDSMIYLAQPLQLSSNSSLATLGVTAVVNTTHTLDAEPAVETLGPATILASERSLRSTSASPIGAGASASNIQENSLEEQEGGDMATYTGTNREFSDDDSDSEADDREEQAEEQSEQDENAQLPDNDVDESSESENSDDDYEEPRSALDGEQEPPRDQRDVDEDDDARGDEEEARAEEEEEDDDDNDAQRNIDENALDGDEAPVRSFIATGNGTAVNLVEQPLESEIKNELNDQSATHEGTLEG
jgi:hypothetical protein